MRIRVRDSRHPATWDLFRPWFAWRPVLVGEYWVWLQTIERRDWNGEGNTYRDYRFADEDDEAEEDCA